MEQVEPLLQLSSFLKRDYIRAYLQDKIKYRRNNVLPYYVFEGEELNNGKVGIPGEIIRINKGLVLYHMTLTEEDSNWNVPVKDSFFAYNLVHPFTILGDFGHISYILNGKYVSRLKRVILVKDVDLKVSRGDSYIHEPLRTRNRDGSIVAGYHFDDNPTPIQEIVLSDGTSVDLLDEIVLDKNFASRLYQLRITETREYESSLGSQYKLVVPTPSKFIIHAVNIHLAYYQSINMQFCHVDNVECLMFLFENFENTIPIEERSCIFDVNVCIFVIFNTDRPYEIVGMIITTYIHKDYYYPNKYNTGFPKIWVAKGYTYRQIVWPVISDILNSSDLIMKELRGPNYPTFSMLETDVRALINENLPILELIQKTFPWNYYHEQGVLNRPKQDPEY